jgi:TolB protein
VDPAWAGGFVYFSSYRSGGLNLWRVKVSADGQPAAPPQQLTTGAGQDVQAALAPGGKSLFFAILRQNADLWRLPVTPASGAPTGPPEALVGSTREDSRGAWSPDGRRVAFNSDRTGDMNLWLRSLDDVSERQLTRGPGGDFQPTWSPDAKSLVFFSMRSGDSKIWSLDVASGALRQLTQGASIDANPFFSPDGTRIAYHSDASGRMEVWTMRADGGEARQLTRVGSGPHFVRWSRDGRSILFRCPCEGEPRTLRVPADGGEPEASAEVVGGGHMSLSPDESLVMDVLRHKELWVSPLRGGRPARVFAFEDPETRMDYPVWSPDGRVVLFDRFRPQGGDLWRMDGRQ